MKETSQLAKNSSATADRSFALDGTPPNTILNKMRQLRDKVSKELTELEATPVPTVKLYKKARQANVSRLKVNLADLNEAIAYEETNRN